jgi:hypothetical protein
VVLGVFREEPTNEYTPNAERGSIKELVTDLHAWIAAWNDNPQTFVWHNSPDEILDRPKKYLTNL